MKKYLFVLIALLIVVYSSDAGQYKKYPEKSGKIIYELTGNTKGSRTLFWDDYGWKEMTIEKSITKIFGIKNETNSYTLIIGTDIYTWKDEDNDLFKSKNPIVDIWDQNQYDDEDLKKFGYDIMESMNFSKVGNETLEGKDCEVWESNMGKIWIWSSYNIKSEVKIMGVKMISVAKDINLDATIPASEFEYPKNRKIQVIEDDNMFME